MADSAVGDFRLLVGDVVPQTEKVLTGTCFPGRLCILQYLLAPFERDFPLGDVYTHTYIYIYIMYNIVDPVG